MFAALNKLGVKVFVATALVVVVALGGALFLTKRKADAAADQSIHRALTATRSNIQAKLDGRYGELSKELRILGQQSHGRGVVRCVVIQSGLVTETRSKPSAPVGFSTASDHSSS